MASNDMELNSAEQVQKDIQGAVNMGTQAAKTANTVQKVAAQASTGNFAGAAFSLVKDPETVKKIVIIVLVPILCIVILMTFFLYALPSMIYEAAVSFFAELAENWSQDTYGSDGGIVWAGVKATVNTVGDVMSELASGIWNTLKNLFASDHGDIDDRADILTDDGIELHVAQNEAAERATLERKIDACIKKLKVRSEQIAEAVRAEEGAIQAYFDSQFSGSCDLWMGTNVDVQVLSLSKIEAVKLLSVYTVMTEASTKNMVLSDFMKWLGFYNEFTSNRITFDIGRAGIGGSVIAWNGSFMPQYLVEQRRHEIDLYGKEMTYFENNMCAAVDLLLVIECPDFATIQPLYTTETIFVDDMDAGQNEDGTYPQKSTSIKVGSATVTVVIKTRAAETFIDAIGLWEGSLTYAQDIDVEETIDTEAEEVNNGGSSALATEEDADEY